MENCAYLRKNPGYAPGRFRWRIRSHLVEASTGRQEEGHAVCVRTLCKGRRNNLSPEGALLFVSLPKGARPLGTRIGTLRYKDGELRRGQHRKSKTGTSPIVAANNKMLKIVYFCVGRRRRYFFDL